MDPNTQQPSSIDYLNSIATAPKQKTMSPLLLWGLVGSGLVAAIVVVILLLSGGSSSKTNLTSVAARLSDLQTISTDAQENLQTSELRSLNSSLDLVLTNANRDIATILADENIELDEKNKQVQAVAAETTELTDTLEDARLNGVYDRTYTREIIYYIKTLRSEMDVVYGSTNDAALKQFLRETNANLKPLQESLMALNIA